jgi:ATP-dependent RNA helicase TDRD9
MSATIAAEQFAEYFALPVMNRLEPAPIITVAGRHYTVQEYYSDDLEALGIVSTT